MAKRNPSDRNSGRTSAAASFELTRIKLLYCLSGVFTLCVAGLLLARPAPLSPPTYASAAQAYAAGALAAATDPLDAVIWTDRGIDSSLWKRIVVERTDSLAQSSFHFAVLPQMSGDQIAISAEWGLQQDFEARSGELRIVLVSADPTLEPAREKTVRLLVERLRDRLRMNSADVCWR